MCPREGVTVFEDGWICRACWQPNRSRDHRCYRCKTPREAQRAVEAGSLKERATPSWEKAGRRDLDLGMLAAIVAWPMWLSGVFIMLLAVFAALAALGAGDRVDSSGTSVRLVMVITAAVLAALAALWIFISRSIRRQARWAYAIAILVYGVPAFVSLLFAVPVPSSVAVPGWSVTLSAILEWVYLVLGLMAGLLLAASFMRHDGYSRQGTTTGAQT